MSNKHENLIEKEEKNWLSVRMEWDNDELNIDDVDETNDKSDRSEMSHLSLNPLVPDAHYSTNGLIALYRSCVTGSLLFISREK